MKQYHTPTLADRVRGTGPGPESKEPVVRCFVCHRALRDPESIERGCGKVCAEKIGLIPHLEASPPQPNITPLFPDLAPEARRVTIHVKRYAARRRRVTCDVCHRRKSTETIHPVSLGQDPAVLAVCEPCIAAIVRYGEKPVRRYLEDRSRSTKEVS